MVRDSLTPFIKSLRSQIWLRQLRLPFGICSLIFLIWLGLFLVDDSEVNQSERRRHLANYLEKIHKSSIRNRVDLSHPASPMPPRAISWSSPLRKQCTGLDRKLRAELISRDELLKTERKTIQINTSNFGKRHDWDIYGRRIDGSPSLIILHETSESLQSALYTFKDYHPKDEEQVSYHTMISLDGKVVDLVKPHLRAYGAGNSAFLGKWAVTNPRLTGSVNNFALHLSLETPWDGRHLGPSHSGYTQVQYDALALVLSGWMKRFEIPPENITTHQHVDLAGERSDPRSFSWPKLQSRLAALEHLCIP